jgi:HK97 family phage major capsid protein
MKTLTSTVALQGWLEDIGPAAFLFRNDALSIEDLQTRLLDLNEEAEAIKATAEAEGRDFTEDEQADLDRIFADFEKAEKDLERRERIVAQTARLGRSLGRQTDPAEPNDGDGEPGQGEDPQNQGRRRVPAQPRNRRETEGRWGWQSFGHFAAAVRSASRNGGAVDPRLIQNAPTTFGTEGVGEDGGFAVPPDFRTAITQAVMGEESLIARTDLLQSSSNTWTAPKDETTPWQGTGGVQAFWENEAAQFNQSKLALEQLSIRLNKLTALVPVSSELLEDAPGLDSYLRRKAPEKMDFRVTDALISGTGAGQPLGILNSPSLVTVGKEGGQTADTVVFENINNMYSRMLARWRTSAVWLINQDIEPQLTGLNFPGDSRPVFMPPGGLSQSPFGTILGRPIVPTEACSTLGDVGDIIFASMGQYLAIQKVGGIRAETSIHLWFDFDLMAFRFIMRLAGQPWWSKAVARFKGGNTLSAFVTLAERA